MQSIDLHAHTTASDGSLTPTELVVAAAHEGLTAIAVTDHDTLDGLAEAEEAARQMNIELVPGIELAVEYPSGRFHMLGYLIDRTNPTLNSRLTLLKQNRANRNAHMVEKLRSLGIDITLEEIVAESGGGQVGRPHMAAALVKKGAAASGQEAFNRYLADGATAHVPKDKISVEEGLELIHTAGGLAVMAHPASLDLEDDVLATELKRLRELGLDGLECYYSQHTSERTDTLLEMARSSGLLATGGSDFHGTAKPHVHLGHVIGNQPAPTALLHALKERKTSNAV
jgi:predicted metal-dependent phosphoesterase TrpH